MKNTKREEYRKVTYPGVDQNRYFISEYGKVYDTLFERFVSSHVDSDGYLRIALSKNNYGVHRIVAYEFCLKIEIFVYKLIILMVINKIIIIQI